MVHAAGPILCDVQTGATADVKINNATALLPPTGGTIDCRGLMGAQTIAANVNMNVANTKYIFADGSTFTANTANVAIIGTASGIEIECGGAGGTVFDWSGVNSTGPNPQVNFNSSNVRIHHCTFIGDRITSGDTHAAASCIRFQNTTTQQRNIYVEDNFIQNCGGVGVSVINYSNVHVQRNLITQTSNNGIQWNTASSPSQAIYREIEIADNVLYDDNTGNATGVGAILVGNAGTMPPTNVITVQGVVVRNNVVKNDIVGGDGNIDDFQGNANICNTRRNSMSTGCGQPIQVNNATFVSITDNIAENTQGECISFTASDVLVSGNRLSLCGGSIDTHPTTITTAGAGGILDFMTNTPPTTQNILIDANHITDSGYGISDQLGSVNTNNDVLLNVTISNNVVAQLNQKVIRGIDIDNRSGTGCGGGPCNFTLTNMNIVDNTVYNATTQAYSLQPVSAPATTMTGAPNLSGNLGNLATASAIANCSSSASPAVCSGAAAGSVVIAAAATTVVVNTTAVTAVSQIQVQFDETLGTKLGVTCNTSPTSEGAAYIVSARAAGTSFTVKASAAPTANSACLSYSIVN
jgi:hypothetical protein